MFKKIRLAIQIALAVWRFLKQVEDGAEARLSDERADADRLWTEATLWKLYEGRDSGWRAYIDIDDAFLRYLQRYLKSSKLGVMTGNASLGDELAVEMFLDTRRTLREAGS